jgi:hypothetical protein
MSLNYSPQKHLFRQIVMVFELQYYGAPSYVDVSTLWHHSFPSDIACMLKLVKSGGLLQNRKEESSEAFTLSFLKEYTCVCVCVCVRARARVCVPARARSNRKGPLHLCKKVAAPC